jgi:hypothetical protein
MSACERLFGKTSSALVIPGMPGSPLVKVPDWGAAVAITAIEMTATMKTIR